MKTIVIISYNIYAYLQRPDLKISGGAELQIATLAKQLSETGYRIIFFTGDFGQDDIVESTGYTFIKIGEDKSGVFKKIKSFVKYIRLFKPEIMLERGTSPFTFLAAILSKFWGIQFVFCGASDVNFAKKEKDPAFNGNWLKQRLYQMSLPLISDFVVQKKSQARLLKENFKIKKNVTLIRNFPPEIYAGNIEKDAAVNNYDAIWLANLIPYKQPELFIELARRNPLHRFLLVGASQDEVYNSLIQNMASSLPNLKLTGYIRHSEVIHWIRKCKIVVNTTKVSTRYEEGFSNVQIMGWLCSKPSLTLISDPDNLIVDNQMGFCSGNFEQLCIDFLKLTEDETLYEQMSKNAVSYAVQNHNTERIFSQYLEVFGASETDFVSSSQVSVQ
jgi:glycosyltransferase involved in cell wall biosynthesis